MRRNGSTRLDVGNPEGTDKSGCMGVNHALCDVGPLSDGVCMSKGARTEDAAQLARHGDDVCDESGMRNRYTHTHTHAVTHRQQGGPGS
jgi:hypothetical protein